MFAAEGARISASKRHLPRPDVLVHHPVAHEAVERPLEAGGLVLLKAEVPHPGKAVAAEQAIQQVLRLARGHQHGQAEQAERGANEVQAAAGAVAVLAQVEGVEVREAFEGPRVCDGRGLRGGSLAGHGVVSGRG